MVEITSAAEQLQGTCLVVGAAMVFALVALVVKRDPLPLLPATECRFLVSWAVSIAFMLAYRKQRGLHWFGPPELRGVLILKCMLSFAFILLWWGALRYAPVGDCIAIIYCSPIVTSLLSRAFLGEALPRVFPAQTLLVSCGVLLVLNPPFLRSGSASQVDENQGIDKPPDYTLVFAALVMCSVVPLATRRTRNCSWIEVEHVSACLAAAALNPALMAGQYAVYGTPPELAASGGWEGALIVLAALGSFLGIAMETRGYQLAEVGKATMFRYIEVPFAYLLQAVGTREPVAARAVLGSVLIIGSCALGAWSQRLKAAVNIESDVQARAPLIDASEGGKRLAAGGSAPQEAAGA